MASPLAQTLVVDVDWREERARKEQTRRSSKVLIIVGILDSIRMSIRSTYILGTYVVAPSVFLVFAKRVHLERADDSQSQ